MSKHPTSFRLSKETIRRLAALAEMSETSKAAFLERLIREAAAKKGLK